jgi:hypothetical protein
LAPLRRGFLRQFPDVDRTASQLDGRAQAGRFGAPAGSTRDLMPSALAGLFMRRLVPAPTLLGRQRSNSTHASTTDPEAQLYRKGPGKEAKLSFMGHAPMETPPCSGYAHYPPRGESPARGARDGSCRMLRNMGGTPWPPPHTRQPPQGEQCGGRCSGVAPKQTVLDAVGAAAELIQAQREYPLVGELVPQKFAPRSAVERSDGPVVVHRRLVETLSTWRQLLRLSR